MVAVENLVVGIHTHLQLSIDKALVECHHHRLKGGVHTTLRGKDILQSLVLQTTLREDICKKSLALACREFIGQHTVLFVEQWLRCCAEGNVLPCRQSARWTAHRHRRPLQHIEQSARGGEQCLHLARLIAIGQHLLAQLIHRAAHTLHIVNPPGCASRILGQRDTLLLTTSALQIGDNGHPLATLGRTLRRYLETTDCINLVAKKVQTDGAVIGKGEYIDNTASTRVLPRLVDKIDPLKSECLDALHHLIHRHLLTASNRERVRTNLNGGRHRFGQRLRIGGDYPHTIRLCTQCLQSGCSLHLARRVGTPETYRAFVACREEENTLRGEQRLQVARKIGCRVPVCRDKDMDTTEALHSGRAIECVCRAGKCPQLGHSPTPQCFAQLFRTLRSSHTTTQHFEFLVHTFIALLQKRLTKTNFNQPIFIYIRVLPFLSKIFVSSIPSD